ncbi:unnamed protein product [Lupinus luteus]|uniref:Uncharacterized protein n=1 Tax=Lupinus luteus TaxID=3873 RepID=A0AAV1WAF5_LUPLU
MVSDDDRSTAADSWSIKSDYGSTLDDEQNQVAAASDYNSGGLQISSSLPSQYCLPHQSGGAKDPSPDGELPSVPLTRHICMHK